jgi:uncharacterized protein (DUF2141 family)
MKNYLLIILLLFTGLFFTSCKKENTPPNDGNYTVTPNSEDTLIGNDNNDEDSLITQKLVITVEGIENIQGLMSFALYNSSETFNEPDDAFREYFIEVTDKPIMQFEFTDIPAGTYALALFHDENSNYELDQNFLTIPQEGFGFSNNAMGNFGPPSYNDAKFELPTASKVEMSINLTFY